MGLTCRTTEIAEIFGVTRRTVTNWKAAGCPVKKIGGRGKEDAYDSAEVYTWLLAQAVGDAAAADPEIKAVRLEILRAEAALRKLKLRQREGELVEAADVSSIMAESFGAIKTGFIGFVPYLYGEVHLEDHKDLRTAYYAISAKVEDIIFSIYLGMVRAFAKVVGQTERKATRLAAEAWRSSFGGRWEEEIDRILKNEEPATPPLPADGIHGEAGPGTGRGRRGSSNSTSQQKKED